MKPRVRANFDRAAATYGEAAAVQRQVARALFERIAVDAPPARIVDAGCGIGIAAPLLARHWPEADVVGVDFAPAMLRQCPPGLDRIAGDVEALPLRDACADLYFSSLTLQWCDLTASLAEAHRVLAPGGTLAVATLSVDTFHELRTAFAGLDPNAHTLDFLLAEEMLDLTRAAGFAQVAMTRDVVQGTAPDLKSLLRGIKSVGAREISGPRRRSLFGKYAWMSVEAQYERFRRKGQLTATYDVVYLTARK